MNLPSPAIEPSPPTRILRELPPRRLDWYTQAVLLLGDFVSQTGWALFVLGSIFFWTTAVRSEVKNWFQDKTADWREKAGVILEADSTNSVEQKKRIWHYRHSFALEGQRYLGESFSVGKKFDAGQIAFIRYDAENPSSNYVIGLRRSQYSWRVNLLLIIPALGLLFIFSPVKQNLRFLRLLKIGDFTRGKLVEKTVTGRSLRQGGKELPVFKYLFQFEHQGVLYHATCRTHRTNLVEDEETEILLFDRYKPWFNLVYDAVPNVPKINVAGKMESAPLEKAWVLFLPAFGVAVNLVFLLLS